MMQTLRLPRLDIASSLGEQCDRCTAAAKLRLVLPSGNALAFCGHHANRNTDDILRQAAQIDVEDGFDWQGTSRAGR